MEAELALTTGEVLVRLAVVLLLVLANGFFVAAEFSLVGARRTRIDALARTGHTRARFASAAIHRLDHYISGTQLGITLASLALGWVGERTVASMLMQWFSILPDPLDAIATHGVAGTIAFAFITFLHIVLGELAPKSLALLHPESTSLWTALPLIVFTKVVAPFVVVLNGTANLLLRTVGLRAATELERVHRPEEIEMLVTQSYEHGLLKKEPVEMIRGIFDLSETIAAEVMTPRTEVIAIPVASTVQQAGDSFLRASRSRLPVYEGSLDRIVGVLRAWEVWAAERKGQTDIRPLIRDVLYVPDSKPVEQLLREMQAERVHLVAVIDEFGGTAGIVTLDDLVGEIVGEIRDEFDATPPEIEETDTGEILLNGSVTIAELNDRYRLKLPEDDYTTVAGYIMGRLGRVAHPGDEVRSPLATFRVLTMSGRRIERLALHLTPPDEVEEEDEE